jgi:hypothetical protein
VAVVTVAGGGTNCLPWAIMRLICRNLMPPRTPAITSKAQKAMKIFFFMVIVRFICGCISKIRLKNAS